MHAPGPIFVGGARRSGTHVLAHLTGRHPDFFTVPREVGFHCAKAGIPGFLAGSVDRCRLASSLLGQWWRRTAPWDPEVTRGLHKTIPVEEFEAAVAAFLTAPADDRADACRVLLHSLLDPLAARAGKPAWVEHTPRNVIAAAELSSFMPHARFIHVVRDGRDQACSVAALPFRGTSVPDELRLWARDLRLAEAGTRSLGREQLLVIQLEELVLLEREKSFEQLVEFLGSGDVEPMRSFFESEVTPERAHIGRSRVELSGQERDEVDALYAELLGGLREDGISCVPAERQPTVSYSGQTAPHPFDPWSDGTGQDG